MPLAWMSLHLLLALGWYHNETHQNLIMRGDPRAECLRTQYALQSGLARILPLQERTMSGARGAHEGNHMLSEVRKLSFLPVLESIVLVIASLYWARAVFVPLALALMLTFLLQPVVAALHRRGLGYAPAAVLVVMLLALAIGAMSWGAVTQLSSLASELPRYQDNLRQKLDDLQHASQGGIFGKIQQTVAELSRKFEQPQLPATAPQEPLTVTPPWRTLVSYVVSYVPSFLGFLVNAALVLVLLLFMLIAHRDLRDRLFRLVGYGRVTVTTKALDEAGRRISRSLMMQAIVNGTYGSTVGLGL